MNPPAKRNLASLSQRPAKRNFSFAELIREGGLGCNSALNTFEFAIQCNLLGKAQLYSQFKLFTFHFSLFTFLPPSAIA